MLKNKLFISAMLSASFTTGLTSRLNVQKSNFSNELLTIHLYAFLAQAYMLAHSLNAVEQDGFVRTLLHVNAFCGLRLLHSYKCF